jgi:hypothetical protein
MPPCTIASREIDSVKVICGSSSPQPFGGKSSVLKCDPDMAESSHNEGHVRFSATHAASPAG